PGPYERSTPKRRKRSISASTSVGNIWWCRVSMMDGFGAGILDLSRDRARGTRFPVAVRIPSTRLPEPLEGDGASDFRVLRVVRGGDDFSQARARPYRSPR